jgi:hypothetical protein
VEEWLVEPAADALDRIELRCFPSWDRNFAMRALRLARLLTEAALDDSIVQFLGSLRVDYPLARVALQHELATFGDGSRIVYVYRDGHPFDAPPDGLGAMRARSRLEELLLASGRAIARADTAAESSAWLTVETRAAIQRSRSMRTPANL